LLINLFNQTDSYAYPVVLDGAIYSDEDWGSPIASSSSPGWLGVSAQNLYVTSDKDYIYFGASVYALDWQGWGFIINTNGAGGMDSDVWTYPISFDHSPRPNFAIRGDFSGYAEFWIWTAGTGSFLSYSISSGDKGISTNMVEIRIPRIALNNPEYLSVQFFITGNNQLEHATFDALPDDENATSWNASTVLDTYVANVDVRYFPPLFPVTFEVTNENPANTQIFIKGSFNSWTNVLMDNTSGNIWTKAFNIPAGNYEWGIVNQDDNWLVSGENLTFSIDASGNISGQTSYTVPAPPPLYDVVFNVDMTTAQGFDPASDIVYLTGSMLSWAEPGTQPENQTMSRVGESMIWTKTLSLQDGMYEFKHFLNAGWDNGEWPGEIPNRSMQVSGQNISLNSVWGQADGNYYIAFNIVNSSGQAITNANITINGSILYGSNILFPNMVPGTYTYTVAAPGYVSQNGEAVITNLGLNIPITLEESPEPEFPVTFTVIDNSLIYENIVFRGSMTAWQNLAMTESPEHTWTITIYIPAGDYYWGAAEDDGSPDGIWLVPGGSTIPIEISAEGVVSGELSFTIPSISPEITFANLQYPDSASIAIGQSINVYAQVEVSNTVLNPESGYENLLVWIGINNENTDPSSWTTWLPATYNGLGTTTNRPEYLKIIGDGISVAGTYYYASRFQLGENPYVYGGFSEEGGGIWDGTNNVSGVLIVDQNIQTFPVTFEVTNENPANTQIFIKGSFNSWTNVLMDNTSGNNWAKTFNIPAGTYEWGLINQDDLWLVSGENLTFSIDASGNITGQTSYTITYSPAEISFANLQWPGNATIETGQTVTVYAQVLAENINFDPETGYENLSVWIGISNENSNPATWTEWIPAPYSGIGTTTQRPEYSTVIGSTITEEGTYYYASRFSVNNGSYVYGGYNNTGGGFWDGTNNISGVLTVIDNIVYYPVTFEVINLNPDNSQIFIKGSFNEWNTVQMDYNDDNLWVKSIDIPQGTFEWGLVNQNDEWLIQGPNLVFIVDYDGSISGQTSYTIPAPEDTVNVLDRWIIYTANEQQVSLAGTTFNGGNLGTFTPSVSLHLDGGGIKTQKSGFYDITGADISYRFYKDGSVPGEFTSSALPFKENLPEEGQQIWENTELGLLISQGLSNGQYFLEIYFTMYFKSSPEGAIQAFIDNNNGDNYKAFFTYDNGIGFLNHDNDLSISVFPNPASNKIQLLFPTDINIENYSISDMIGKTWIYEKAPDINPLVIDVSMLPPGTYLLTFSTENKIISRKLIIQ